MGGGSLRIAVLMGGANSERNVSLSSGLAVARALRGLGHAVAAVDSAASPVVPAQPPEQEFLTAEVEPDDRASRPVAPSANAPPDLSWLAEVRARQDDGVLAPGLLPILRCADVVFLTVYGDEGESGATRRYLDARGIRSTGPSAEVCARTFDKEAAKRALAGHGVDTPAGRRVRRGREDEDLDRLDVPGPWMVKPVEGGSSIGLSHVENEAGLGAAVRLAGAAGGDALVEEHVPGRDLTIGVLGDRVFAPVEIVTGHAVYDYDAKYTPGEARKQAPADLDDRQTDEVRRLAAVAHRVLGVGDTSSRSDFRLRPDGRFVFFELNPLPGMTPTSGYPISARACGLDFPRLCEELVLRAIDAPSGSA